MYFQIVDMAEINRLTKLQLLRQLTLCGNPVCELPDYRAAVIFTVSHLTQLDGVEVAVDEKVSINIYYFVDFTQL